MSAYEQKGQSDEWYTPRYIFDALGAEFDLDVAAPPEGPRHVPAEKWLSVDGLNAEWSGFVWMNPPFGNQKNKIAWLTKFFSHGDGIALLPDRSSASWFQKFAPMADAILWIGPKVKFERPDGVVGGSPGTGTVLFAAGQAAAEILGGASSLGFVTVNMKQEYYK